MDNPPERTYEWTVSPLGRWSWHIQITHGWSDVGQYGWRSWGSSMDRAIRKAERLCAKFQRQDDRRESMTVSSD